MFQTGTRVAFPAYDDRIKIRPPDETDDLLSCAYAGGKVLAKDRLSKEEDEASKNL